MSAFATATVVFMSCSAARVGAMVRTRRAVSIANWACNCATRRPSAGSRPSCAPQAGHTIERDLGNGLRP